MIVIVIIEKQSIIEIIKDKIASFDNCLNKALASFFPSI
jgi:hypothetical protein